MGKTLKESDIQSALVDYANYRGVGNYLIHIPNEQLIFSTKSGLTKRQKIGWWRKLKKMGFKKGASDLFLALPRGEHHGLWLEVKCPKNRPTPSQVEFLKIMRQQDYACDIAYGVDQGVVIINRYLSY